MRVLFYLYPCILPLGPEMNGGWTQILAKIMRGLVSTDNVECKIVTAERFRAIAGGEVEPANICCIDEIRLHRDISRISPDRSTPTLVSFDSRHSSAIDQPSVGVLLQHIIRATQGYRPDLVITFAMQADYLKIVWPSSTIFYVEASAFSRHPYPFSIFLDHRGMYGAGTASMIAPHLSKVSGDDLQLVDDIKRHNLSHFTANDPFRSLDFDRLDSPTVLLPLQVSNYFSFDEQSPYKTQFEYLMHVLSAAPESIRVVATEYTQWGHVIQKSGASRNYAWLANSYPNLSFHDEFRCYASSSQYIVPRVDGVISFASNLGYQALLFNKTLLSGPTSYTYNVAHHSDFSTFFSAVAEGQAPASRNAFLAWYFKYYAIPYDLACDGRWFSDYLERRLAAIAGAKGVDDDLVPVAALGELYKHWLPSGVDTPAEPWG